MIFDLVVLVIVVIALLKGYSKGMVSSVLSLGLYAASFFLVMYINSQVLLIETPMGLWGQGIILFIILSLISNAIIKFINFEDIMVLGFFSRILGAIFYGLITLAIIVFLMLLALSVAGEQILTSSYFQNSLVIEWMLVMLQQLPILDVFKLEL